MSRAYAATGSASEIGQATKQLLEERANRVIKARLEAIPMPLNGPAQPVVVARLLAWLVSRTRMPHGGNIDVTLTANGHDVD